MPSQPLVSIIIVSYNTAKLTLQTIDSVLADIQGKSSSTHAEIIIVDNASSDTTIEMLMDHYSLIKSGTTWRSKSLPITLLKNSSNVGFAKANNQGIAVAQGDYFFLLNSDTIVQPGTLTQLITAYQDHPVDDTTAHTRSNSGKLDRLGILAASLANPDGTPQPQGGSLPSLFSLTTHMLFIDDLPLIGKLIPSTQHTGLRSEEQTRQENNNRTLVQKGWVAATALLIKRQLVDEVGPLDHNIFMYAEDIELCLRAKKHHWDCAIHPTAIITHFGSASSSSKKALIGELNGYKYLWAKHYPSWQLPIATFVIWLGAYLRLFLFGTLGIDRKKAEAYFEFLHAN